MTGPARRSPAPVFVGGTGRSGTTIVAGLIGEHPAYQMVPYEAKFHASAGGLPDLLSGGVDLEWFLARMSTHWFQHVNDAGQPDGLSALVGRAALGQALDQFAVAYASEPVTASAELLDRLVQPHDPRGTAWVEMTPSNIEAAQTLHLLFPEARFIHVVRNGRDVAHSLKGQAWAPDDLFDCLLWWEERLTRADVALRRIPRDQTLTIRLENLVRERREEEFRRLLDFLDGEEHPAMRRFFDTTITPRGSQIGRWRDLPEREQRDLLALYAKIVRRLRRRGVRSLPSEPGSEAPLSVRSSAGSSLRSTGRSVRWRIRRRAARVKARLTRARAVIGQTISG
jgi:Sulfotransferase family